MLVHCYVEVCCLQSQALQRLDDVSDGTRQVREFSRQAQDVISSSSYPQYLLKRNLMQHWDRVHQSLERPKIQRHGQCIYFGQTDFHDILF